MAQAEAVRRIGTEADVGKLAGQGYGLTPWAIIGATCCRYNAPACASTCAQQLGYLGRGPAQWMNARRGEASE